MNSISVVIPAYNRAALIGDTIRSLLHQSLPAQEIIVVDDGSTDNTVAVARSFGPTVRVICQPNAGPASARNTGWRHSKGAFLHFVDSDDILLPNKHEVQIAALERSGADIAYGPWVKGRIDPNGFTPENHVLQQMGLPFGDLVKALLTYWSIVPHACLFRRDIVAKIGGFPVELFAAEDQLMFLRCLLAGAKVVHSPGTLELYRTNDSDKITSSNATAQARHDREWARFLIMARQECLSHGIDPARWFGFKRRAWEAARALRANRETCPQLYQQLQVIQGSPWRASTYWVHKTVQTKQQGLQWRMSGARGNSFFRMAPLSDEQISAIHQMFPAVSEKRKKCAS